MSYRDSSVVELDSSDSETESEPCEVSEYDSPPSNKEQANKQRTVPKVPAASKVSDLKSDSESDDDIDCEIVSVEKDPHTGGRPENSGGKPQVTAACSISSSHSSSKPSMSGLENQPPAPTQVYRIVHHCAVPQEYSNGNKTVAPAPHSGCERMTNETPQSGSGCPDSMARPVSGSGQPVSMVKPVSRSGQPVSLVRPVSGSGQPVSMVKPVSRSGQPVSMVRPVSRSGQPVSMVKPVSRSGQPVSMVRPVSGSSQAPNAITRPVGQQQVKTVHIPAGSDLARNMSQKSDLSRRLEQQKVTLHAQLQPFNTKGYS